MERLLVIDDSLPFLRDIESSLRDHYTVLTTVDTHKAMEILKREQIAAVLLNPTLPSSNGNHLLTMIRTEIDPLLPVLIVTDNPNSEYAVEAMRNGAHDFVLKNFSRDLLLEKIAIALERRRLEIRVTALQGSVVDIHEDFVFRSQAMKRVHAEITRLARLQFDVLIEGETGVGKDLIAYEIHKRSNRATKPFLPLAMKAYSETLIESELFGHERGAFTGADRAKPGKLEAADGGTIYLPEISSLSEAVQLKLLHFMQYKTVVRVGQDPMKPAKKLDVRVIMATNESLEELVNKGRMRKDFFHRINGVTLHVPALRERSEDLELLADHFLRRHAKFQGEEVVLAPEALSALHSYTWPGNVRELENWIKNAIAYSDNTVLTVSAFPHLAEPQQSPDECQLCMATRFQTLPKYKEALSRFKRAYFSELLRRTQGRNSRAATLAGITSQGLGRILKSLHIEWLPVVVIAFLNSMMA